MLDHRHLRLRKLTQTQTRHRRDARLVLIAQRHVQQDVLIVAHTRFGQFFSQRRSDFQCGGKARGDGIVHSIEFYCIQPRAKTQSAEKRELFIQPG